jgi:hypothetical protein
MSQIRQGGRQPAGDTKQEENKMKKSLVVMVLVLLVGAMLTAAKALPPATQNLQGTLRFQRNNVCGVSDFVLKDGSTGGATPVYLTGKFQPTNGILQGCHLSAVGFFYQAGACHYFFTASYTVGCLTGLPASSQR